MTKLADGQLVLLTPWQAANLPLPVNNAPGVAK